MIQTNLGQFAVNVEVTGLSHFATDKSVPKATDPAKDKSEIVIYGFSLVGTYSKTVPISEELLPLTVAHLYQDQELVTIPTKIIPNNLICLVILLYG